LTSGPRKPGPTRLVLASASPRRRELLSGAGIPFDVVVPDVRELREGVSPEELVVENARLKARAGLDLAGDAGPVLGVDTDVALDGRALGKPSGTDAARERLELLSGRTHEVLSGVVLIDSGPDGARERSGLARTAVTFKRLEPATIELYLESGEWRDRAGAYAVQGLGSILIERIEGDLSNVIGLPLTLLMALAPEIVEASRPEV
jgi:septum formation protein